MLTIPRPESSGDSDTIYLKARLKRNDPMMARALNEFDTVLLSSQAVAWDFHKLFPKAKAKPEVMPFVPAKMDLLKHDNESIENVLQLYDIPSKFFYAPNGFCQHKNLGFIIEALQILKGCRHESHFVSE